MIYKQLKIYEIQVDLRKAHKFMKYNLVRKQLINSWHQTWSTNSSKIYKIQLGLQKAHKFMKYNWYKILQKKKGQERDTTIIYEILRQTESLLCNTFALRQSNKINVLQAAQNLCLKQYISYLFMVKKIYKSVYYLQALNEVGWHTQFDS